MGFLADENVHYDIIQFLREYNLKVLFVPEIGMSAENDDKILEYSEKHDLILISGDKDFGRLIEFGTLWGRGRVILLRYRVIIPIIISQGIISVLKNESKLFQKNKLFVIVISESRYRVHIPR